MRENTSRVVKEGSLPLQSCGGQNLSSLGLVRLTGLSAQGSSPEATAVLSLG